MFGGNFAPRGYAFCNGQLLDISQNDALFALIDTTYGGDGQTTFALPDMRGRAPVHQGTLAGGGSYVMGQAAGTETVTLLTSQLPPHTHTPAANSGDGGQPSPQGNVWGLAPDTRYNTNAPAAPMNPASIGLSGGSQPHDNMPPFLCVSFVIALEGIFPPRN
jgi:microcystin-dependent protein